MSLKPLEKLTRTSDRQTGAHDHVLSHTDALTKNNSDYNIAIFTSISTFLLWLGKIIHIHELYYHIFFYEEIKRVDSPSI